MKSRFWIIAALYASLTLPLFAAQKPIKIACVGNSITQGATIVNAWRDGYPGLLGQMLGEAYEVRNYGYSGRTLLLKGDRPWMKETMYQDALAFCPDIVTIKLGTNDTKPFNWIYGEEFPADLETLVRSFQELPSHPKIYLCYPVPAYRLDWGINDSIILNGVIPYINQVAAKTGASVIDLYTPFTGKPEWFNDRIHPNEEGALQLAKLLYTALTGRQPDPAFQPQAYPGVKSEWKGYDCYHFNYKERQVKLVVPQQAAPGNPWIWRPAFFGAFAQVDEALLAKGYHVVFMDLAEEYGSPESLKAGDALYKYLVKFYGFSKKVCLEGFSRGGIYALEWAANYPNKVSCVYLDAPVCDVHTWPGNGDPKWEAEWQRLLNAWDMTPEQAADFPQNPILLTDTLAKQGIPFFVVAGKKDRTVPFKANAGRFIKEYKKKGGPIDSVLKPKGDHHPHSLDNPEPVVRFIETHNVLQP